MFRRRLPMSLVILLTLTSTAMATEIFTDGESKRISQVSIIEAGYVNPSMYDMPFLAANHLEAYNWLVSLHAFELTALANKFHQKTGKGKPIDGHLWKIALKNYKQKIDAALAGKQLRMCDTDTFTERGKYKTYNEFVVHFAASHMMLIEKRREIKMGKYEKSIQPQISNDNRDNE